jgi:hypothetical protein
MSTGAASSVAAHAARLCSLLQRATAAGQSVLPNPGRSADAIAYEEWAARSSGGKVRGAIWSYPSLAAAVQQNWLAGQRATGCHFASWLARDPEHFGWHRHTIMGTTANIRDFSATSIERIARSAVADPSCELVSLVFPEVRDDSNLVGLLKVLAACDGFYLESAACWGESTAVAIRYRVGRSAAWVMCLFGGIAAPHTRRSPCVEVVIRPKVKTTEQCHPLMSQDSSACHVADTPTNFSEDKFAEWIGGTEASVKAILTPRQRQLIAARVTCVVPTELWFDDDIVDDSDDQLGATLARADWNVPYSGPDYEGIGLNAVASQSS